MRSRRHLLAPEVIQTSNMDCGPAALKCLLEGFGVHASYGRLREACQTDVDGTSIDTMEEAARQLGLDAEQIMLPVDHVLLPEAQALPAIIVVRLPNAATHFVVAWRRHGAFVQLMDPATGRRWTAGRRWLEEVYVHGMAIPAAAWREWAGGQQSIRTMRRRLQKLGVSSGAAIDRALDDPGWRAAGTLDAAIRLTDSLVRSGAIRRGRQAERVIERFCAQDHLIPLEYWSVRPHSDEEVILKGAVLVRILGRLPTTAPSLSPELAAALAEAPARPGRDLLALLRADGMFSASSITLALVVAAGAVVVEGLLFRGIFDVGRELGLSGQRLGAIAALVAFLIVLLLLEIPLSASLLRLGRRLEARLRLSFLEKIPRLGDRYFQSRLKSDMAERSHTTHLIRHLPDIGGQLARSVFEAVFTAGAIAWMDPAAAPLALATAACAIVLPILTQPALIERDLRVRCHAGALTRFYLDALLGVVAIRAHGAERAIRREHGNLLREWARARLRLQGAAVWIQTVQLIAAFGLAAWLLLDHLNRNADAGGVLLLVYWALNLPVIGQDIAQIAWQYPAYRNVTLRLLEPLGALEESNTGPPARPPAIIGEHPRMAISVVLQNVTVRAAGHAILTDINLDIPAGNHIAIVGPSGAGKSSLVGLLLGWYRAAAGGITVDGAPLETCIDGLRHEIAWVDPAVHLWNRSLIENLSYGAGAEPSARLGQVIEAAELRQVLEKLPDGLQTSLGEGGSLVSGGEGQRVRLGRAMLRRGVRLVILDEPFRGLDRSRRRDLLVRARALWKGATLLCITHDVGETLAFERVLVIEDGRLVEDADPAALAARAGSRYRAMLEAEDDIRQGLWSDAAWVRLKLQEGKLTLNPA